MTALLSVLLLVPVTVDRIEPPMAVVEWPWGELHDVPLEELPPDLAEGAQLRLVYPVDLLVCTRHAPVRVQQ